MRAARLALAALLVLPPLALADAGIERDLALELGSAPTGKKIEIILHLSGGVDLSAYEGIRGRGARRAALVSGLRRAHAEAAKPVEDFLAERGAEKRASLWHINALAVSADAETVKGLSALPNVERISLDKRVPMEVSPLAAAVSQPGWNMAAVGAQKMWAAGHEGDGTVVAVLDSGVDPKHSAFSQKWTGRWFDPNGEHAEPADTQTRDYHGTKVMGIILGENPSFAMGVAPKSKWMAAKIFSDAGDAQLSSIHASFAWLLDPDGDPGTDDGPDAVNNSWGFPGEIHVCDMQFATDITVLRAADIMVVFAAGNFGPVSGTDLPPANNPGAASVGGVGPDLTVVLLSSRGPSACNGGIFPIVTAPGASITTSDYTFGGLFPNATVTDGGTSFAAPHLSGAALLLRSAWPDRTMAEIEDALRTTATDLGTAGPDNSYGYGMIDVFRAYHALAPAGCADLDDDGYFTGPPECGVADCNDSDPEINPKACDEPKDGVDQDCSGADALTGPSCNPAPPPSGGGGGGGGCFIERIGR